MLFWCSHSVQGFTTLKTTRNRVMFLGEEWTWRKQQRSFSEDCLFAHIHPGRLCIFFCVLFCIFFCALCLFAHIHPGRVSVDLCTCKFMYFIFWLFFCNCSLRSRPRRQQHHPLLHQLLLAAAVHVIPGREAFEIYVFGPSSMFRE